MSCPDCEGVGGHDCERTPPQPLVPTVDTAPDPDRLAAACVFLEAQGAPGYAKAVSAAADALERQALERAEDAAWWDRIGFGDRHEAEKALTGSRMRADRMQLQRDAERAARERAERLIEDFASDEDCQYDHHGYCQAHLWFRVDPPCPCKRAKDLLAQRSVPAPTPAEATRGFGVDIAGNVRHMPDPYKEAARIRNERTSAPWGPDHPNYDEMGSDG